MFKFGKGLMRREYGQPPTPGLPVYLFLTLTLVIFDDKEPSKFAVFVLYAAECYNSNLESCASPF